jgi:hypothetical protein
LAIAGWDGRVTFWQESPENPDDPSAPSNVGDLHFVQAAAQPDALEPPPSKQYAEEFHPTLKGNAAAIPGLAIYGPDADACVKFEPEGLRVSLPIGYPRQRPGTGAITDFGVKGDLDISMTFEILPQAKPGLLNGRASLKLMLVPKEEPIPEVWTKANKNRAGLSRDFSSLNNAGSFVANVTQWTGEIPKDQWNNETFTKVEQSSGTLYPAIASTGRLRLVRSGSALYFFTSDGDDADFILRRKDEFGSKDLKNVRILASTGGPDASLNVRVTDLQIRADALLKATQQAFVPPTAERRSWLLPICAVALLVFLMASVAGAVLVALKRRGAAPVKSAPPKKAPAPFVFPCPECGKRLKTKTHQAGKKLKCPHCAAAVAIPKAGAETGKKPS